MEYTGERIVPENPVCKPGTLIYETHVERYRFAKPFVEGRTVLDIACGVGYGCHFLANHGARLVIGGDISQEAVRYATTHYATPKACYVPMSALDIALASSSVETVVSFETLEHLPDVEPFLGELNRVLRPGGYAVISTPNKATYGLERDVPDNEFHTREYTLTEFQSLLSRFFHRVTLFAQRRLIRRSRLATRIDTLARRMRIADRLGLRKLLMPRRLRSLISGATDAYDQDCGVGPLRAGDEPLFFVAVAERHH